MSHGSPHIPVLALMGLTFTVGCHSVDPVVGEWTARDHAEVSLKILEDTGGRFEYYTEDYPIEVNIEEAPDYRIEIKNDGDGGVGDLLQCRLTADTLACEGTFPYTFDRK